MLRPGLDLWLDIKDLQLYKTISLEYVRDISDIGYKMKNYNNKTKS